MASECFYCGSATGPFIRDHFLPRAFGGSDHGPNRVTACTRCDRRKGSMFPADWLRVCPQAGSQRVQALLAKQGLATLTAQRAKEIAAAIGLPGDIADQYGIPVKVVGCIQAAAQQHTLTDPFRSSWTEQRRGTGQ